MRAQRGFAEGIEVMANTTKLTLTQKELNDKLITAAESGDVESVNGLIEKGADVNAGISFGGTALHRAASGGHVDVAMILIANGANVNTKNKYRATALHLAAWNGNVEVVKILIESGADVNSKDKDNVGNTALSSALRTSSSISIFKISISL